MKFSSLSLLWKILLSTSVALTALFAITGWIVQNHVIQTTEMSLEEEVRSSSQAYESLWKSRADNLGRVSLILSVLSRDHFWISYGLMCFAIPGPFAAMAPFWSIPSETLPRSFLGLIVGVVNAFGNLGGFVGPYVVGWLKDVYHSTAIPFNASTGAYSRSR